MHNRTWRILILSSSKSLATLGALLMSTAMFSSSAVAAPTKVAFIADQGNNSNANAVLTLIQNEGTDLLLIQGDLGYKENAATQWDANLTNALGRDFPVLTVVGNHENFEWPLYQKLIKERVVRNSKLDCIGNTGVKAKCRFGNIDIVQVAQGVTEVAGVKSDDSYDDYIRSSFSTSGQRWRICSWHKNQKDMQPAEKRDSTGWTIYDACLDAGAMIAMGHAHAYSRTHLLSNFEEKTIVSKSSDMTLKAGQSFAVVSGLGGRDVVEQKNDGDWFGSIYTASQGATHGALFCSFDITTADCYFKAIDGAIPDRFTLTLDTTSPKQIDSETAPPAPEQAPLDAGYVFSRTDTTEFRWIDFDTEGTISSQWITTTCAEEMGGASVSGDWSDLQQAAPNFNTIENPCTPLTVPESTTFTSTSTTPGRFNDVGYVYSRTDKQELRWIARDDKGIWGSIWINQACSNRLGGPKAYGDWFDLMREAPGFDTIPNPCP